MVEDLTEKEGHLFCCSSKISVSTSLWPPCRQTFGLSMPPEMVSESLQPPQGLPQPPAQLPKIRATRNKDGKRLNKSGCRSKRKHPKDSTCPLKNMSRINKEAELSTQPGESLRWEGALEDPQAEERRLELYRANRRQRYIANGKAVSKDSQTDFLTGSKEIKSVAQSEQQVAASMLHLRVN